MRHDEILTENLRKWFKEKWVRFGPDGKIRGDCARGSDSEGKPKCLPQSKAHSLGKKGRASAAAKKRREDPNPERRGAAKNVATRVKEEQLDEKCWKGYHKEGNKELFGKTVPNCVKNESRESCPECGGDMYPDTMIMEKKDACYYKVKSRYKVWPSAYASGALVQCRKKGAKNWGSKNESIEAKRKELEEAWSQKYKKSINCNNPKGFSQKAHCAGRKKNESVEEAKLTCPPATQDIGLNLRNRQKAINEYGYGPLNPNEPNRTFWLKKQEMWQLDTPDAAKKSLCGNCAAFDISDKTLDCIAKGIGSDSGSEDPRDVIDAGELGYCRFLKFKCASKRTCDAWVVGGPIKEGKHCDEKNAVKELHAALVKRKQELKDAGAKTAYDKIDKIMTRIANTYKLTGQELHDMWTDKYGEIPDTWVLDENFADGKNPGRKGLAKRSGVNCKASVTQLRKVAKNSTGEKARMAHWCANMKAGKKK